MRRSLRKLMVLAMAIVMMFAMSITAFAAGSTDVKAIKIVNEGTTKKVGSATLYLNADEIDDIYYGIDNRINAPVDTMTYDLQITGKDRNADTINKALTVATKNRGIATGKVQTVDGKDKLVVTATGVGKTTITVTDAKTKKSAKITVTVKNLVDEISYGAATETDDLTGVEYVRVEKKGKVNLLASTNADASNKKLKYTILEHKVLKDGKWIDSVNNKNKTAAVVKVDAKGNVTALTDAQAKAVVCIYAQDQKAKVGNKTYTTGVYKFVTVYTAPASYAKNDIIQITNLNLKKANAKLGKNNTYAAQTLYTNTADAAHTLTLTAAAYDYAKEGRNVIYTANKDKKVVYTTSNAKVATVSADGVVTAVGNGKATISAVPAYGFTSPKATVQVTVKTKPEVITLAKDYLQVATKKTVKISAGIVKTASYKNLGYEVIEGKDYATVNAKGVVKGVAEGTAKVKVFSKDFPEVNKVVTVDVLNPVNKVAITDADGKAIPKKTITLYAYNGSTLKTKAPSTYQIKADVTAKTGTPTNAETMASSSKGSVAGVDGTASAMTIWANGPGTAKITVTAVDGSKKKDTVTVKVKQLVDEINVANSYSDWKYNETTEEYDEYKVLNVIKGVKTAIKATPNSNASNKKLTYELVGDATGITLDNKGNITVAKEYAGGEIVINIKANDGVTLSETETTEAFVQKLIINPVDGATYATDETVNISGEYDVWNDAAFTYDEDGDVSAVIMKKGKKVTLSANFANDVTDRTAKWSLKKGSKGIAVKNGVVTAKSVTDNATVVLTYKTGAGKNDVATKEVKVCVIQSDADYQKAISKNVKAQWNAEDRSYLGAKAKFNDKNGRFDVQITDPSVVIADQKDTGVLSVFETLVDITTDRVEVCDYPENTDYIFERVDGSFDVKVTKYVDDEEVFVKTISGFDAIGELIKEELTACGYVTLGDMNGIWPDLYVYSVVEKDGFAPIESCAHYDAMFYINGADMETAIDANIQAGIDNLNASGVLDAAGISSVTYDAARNTATVNLKDASVTVAEAEAAVKTEVIKTIEAIFADVEEADANVYLDGELKASKSYYDGDDLVATMEDLFAEVIDRIGADTAIGQFEGGRADAKVTYRYGIDRYTYEYVVNFARTAEAVDAQVDEKIAASIDAKLVNVNDSGLTAGYDAETNTLTVKVDKTDYSVVNLQSTGLTDAIKKTLADVAAAGTKVSATVSTVNGDATIEDLANVSVAKLEEAMGLEDCVTLADLLDNKDVTITVTYPSIISEVTLSYKVKYELNMDAIDQEMDAVIEKAIADAKADPVFVAEATGFNVADHKISVMLNAANDMKFADADAIYEIFAAMIPNGENGLSARSIYIVNGTDYQMQIGYENFNKAEIGKAVINAVGSTADGMVSDLAGNTLTLKVVYMKGNELCSIVYTVEFAINEAPVDNNVTETVVEEVTEETTEEVTEETTEETTEEVVEETTEETTEEVVEETVEETTEETVETITE